MPIRNELDKAQRILQDASPIGTDGEIWSRAELLSYFHDAYRHLLAETSARRRFTVLPVPPRFAWAVTHEWQRELLPDGPIVTWAFQGEGGWAASHLWGLEQVEGISPTNSGTWSTTQPYQRTFHNPVHQHFRFAVPRDTERVVKIWHNHQLLIPISTRSIDATETNWYSLDGEPIAWCMGIGPNRTFEVFEIETGYTSDYDHVDTLSLDANPLHGIARRLTGDRTYTAVQDDGGSIPYGIIRRIESADRQYYPRVDEPLRQPLGRSCWFASSVSNLLVLEARIPDEITLTEDDEAALLPMQLNKYMRYYTLMRAFNRQGPGYDGAMAAFYEMRFNHGLQFLRRLHQLARKDRQVQRGPIQRGRRRPPRVRLPSNYPRVLPV